MKKHFYGGQAVIEGVMIRGQKNCVVAVRNPEKNIVIKQIKIPSFSKAIYKKIPFIRGVIILLEMMVIGYRSLTKSSEIVEENQNINISTIAYWQGYDLAKNLSIYKIYLTVSNHCDFKYDKKRFL